MWDSPNYWDMPGVKEGDNELVSAARGKRLAEVQQLLADGAKNAWRIPLIKFLEEPGPVNEGGCWGG